MKIPTLLGLRYRTGVAVKRASLLVESVAGRAALALAPAGRRPPIVGVVCGRNDDYMPDFEHRLQATVEWNLRYLLSEVIFVEWNTAPDRPLLAPGIAKAFPRVRSYVVPPKVHAAVGGTERVPMLEFHAKNVGIRRARAPWILATNADALVGYSTARRLRARQIDPGSVWTAQRIDISWRLGRREPATLLDVLWYRRVIPDHDLGTGEFLLASEERWLRACGYDETSTTQRIGIDKRGAAQLRLLGGTLRRAGTVFHMAHPTSCTEGIRGHHGEMASLENLPYANSGDWGLASAREIELAERVWRLEI